MTDLATISADFQLIPRGFQLFGIPHQTPAEPGLGHAWLFNGSPVTLKGLDMSRLTTVLMRLDTGMLLEYVSILRVHSLGLFSLYRAGLLDVEKLLEGHEAPGGFFVAPDALIMPTGLALQDCPERLELWIHNSSPHVVSIELGELRDDAFVDYTNGM